MAFTNIAPAPAERNPTVIYGLIDPRSAELRYVGKTRVGVRLRLAKHIDWFKYRAAEKQTYVSRWVGSLVTAGVEPEIVEFETITGLDCWREAEKFWIAYWRAMGARLCNLTLGGEGIEGFRHSVETNRKNAEKHRRLWADPEYRARQAASHEGKMPDGPTIAKGAAKRRGRKDSAETRAKKAAAKRAMWTDPEIRARLTEKSRERARDPEMCQRIANAQKGKETPWLTGVPKSESHRAALSAATKGRPLSDAHKAALKAAQIRRRSAERAAVANAE